MLAPQPMFTRVPLRWFHPDLGRVFGGVFVSPTASRARDLCPECGGSAQYWVGRQATAAGAGAGDNQYAALSFLSLISWSHSLFLFLELSRIGNERCVEDSPSNL